MNSIQLGVNIDHAIVASSMFVGLDAAVREMKRLMWRLDD